MYSCYLSQSNTFLSYQGVKVARISGLVGCVGTLDFLIGLKLVIVEEAARHDVVVLQLIY